MTFRNPRELWPSTIRWKGPTDLGGGEVAYETQPMGPQGSITFRIYAGPWFRGEYGEFVPYLVDHHTRKEQEILPRGRGGVSRSAPTLSKAKRDVQKVIQRKQLLSGKAQENPAYPDTLTYREYYRIARERGRSPAQARSAWKQIKEGRKRRTRMADQKASYGGSPMAQHKKFMDALADLIESVYGKNAFYDDYVGRGLLWWDLNHADPRNSRSAVVSSTVELEAHSSPKTGLSELSDKNFIARARRLAAKYPTVKLKIVRI
jgi:hypothetical protein